MAGHDKKKKNLPPSLIVTQSNELVSARYTLPLAEQRLVLMMIARIQPDDEDFKPYHISISEFADFLGIAKGSMYLECKKITKSLLGRVLEIKESNRLLQTNWVSSADYIEGSGVVKLSIDPLLKPFLLQLQGNFTSCRLEILLSFKSQYTMRIYTLLKQYNNLKEREIELFELRHILGLRTEQHSEYSNFKKNILITTQKDLFEKGDIHFEFDEIKYGRSVGAIKFIIYTTKLVVQKNLQLILDPPTQCAPEPETLTFSPDLMQLLPEQHKTKKTVLKALESFEKKHGFDYVKRNILYCNAKADKSYAGFLHNALKNDWGHDWELEQQPITPIKAKVKDVWERQGFASEQEYAQAMFQRQISSLTK